MQSQKQRLKRQAKKKELDIKKTDRKVKISRKIKEAKSHYAKIKAERQAEAKIMAYIFKAVNGVLPAEGESLDANEIKTLCERFLKEKPDVAYYESIAKFAEKKIKQVELFIAQEKKLKKLTKKK